MTTSTYMMMSSSISGGVNYNNSNNHLHNFSTYGLNYYNESTGSEFSDGYQSSISPDLSSCQMKGSQFYHNDFQHSHHHPSHNIQNSSIKFQHKNVTSNGYCDLNMYGSVKFSEIKNFSEKIQTHHHQQYIHQKKKSPHCNEVHMTKKSNVHTKPPTIAPEILKRRRSAANARERRRMNSLNFAFDK